MRQYESFELVFSGEPLTDTGIENIRLMIRNFIGCAADMRGENDIGAVHDFQVFFGRRLVIEDVEHCACDSPVIEDTDQRLGVHQRGAAGIDKQGVLFHGAQQLFIDKTAGGIADRQMQGNDIAACKELFQ